MNPFHRRPSLDVSFLYQRRPSYEDQIKNQRRPSHDEMLQFQRRPSLEDQLNHVLQNELICLEFKAYMKSRKCEENLYFWIDVELFKIEVEEDMFEQADQIYEKFFSETAEYQINLDAETVRDVTSRIGERQIDRNMFDEAQKATFKLMETACIAGFQQHQVDVGPLKLLNKNPSLIKKIFKIGSKESFPQRGLHPRTVSNTQLNKYFEKRPDQS